MLRLNPHVYPQGGFRFVDPEGNRFTGTTAVELSDMVREFRQRLGKPIGQPYDEVVAYLCQVDPTACYDTPQPALRSNRPIGVTTSAIFGAKVMRWIVRVAEAVGISQIPLVHKSVAIPRAKTCLGCPHQVSWKTGCGGCDGNAIRMSLSVRQGRETPESNSLRACEILGEDTRTSIWLSQKPVVGAQLPKHCWRQ
jgi:hypothetical protein